MEEARVNVSYQRGNGDLRESVRLEVTNDEILSFVAEAIRGGNIAGIAADPSPDLRGYKVDRYEPNQERPHHYFVVRPATPFGATKEAGP